MKYLKSKEIVSSALDEEIIVLNLNSGEYFSFVGLEKLIWENLDHSKTAEDLLKKISTVYELTSDSYKELEGFLEELRENNLIINLK